MTAPILRMLLARQFREPTHIYLTLPDDSEVCVTLDRDKGTPIPGLPGIGFDAYLVTSAPSRRDS
jgi:hypothetical protein